MTTERVYWAAQFYESLFLLAKWGNKISVEKDR